MAATSSSNTLLITSSFLVIFFFFVSSINVVMKIDAQPLVPALLLFGDSSSDSGNNNYLKTIVKSNFPPYGRDFIKHKPTGRFSNGKLATDFTAENLGFTTYPLPYLSKKANGKNLLIGANFASAGSGYYEGTAELTNALPLSKQVEMYKEYQDKLVVLVGKVNASSTINGSIHLLSAGSSDFVQNYYINPFLYEKYTTDQFSDILIQSYIQFVLELYKLGGRKIGVTTLPPIGCLPASITLFSEDSNKCVEKMNKAAVAFNNKLNSTSQNLQKKFSDLNIVVLDIYHPLFDMINKPQQKGFFEARKACCGTGLIETSYLCEAKSPGTCANASQYVFWDAFHPSEAANKVISDDLLISGLNLV